MAPIDASIPLQARAPAFNTPFENLGQMMQLRQQQQQMQTQQALEEERRQRVQKEQQAQAERERFNQIIGNPNLTRESFLNQVKTQAPNMYFDAVKQFDEQDSRAAGIQKSRAELAEKQAGYVSGLAARIQANDYAPEAFELGLQHVTSVFPDFKPQADEYRKIALDNGPNAIRNIVDGLIAQTPNVASEVRQQKRDELTAPSVTPNAQGLTPAQAEQARPKMGTLEEFILSKTGGRTAAQIAPNERTRLKAEWEAAGREPKMVEITVQENGQWVTKRVPESSTIGKSYPVAPSGSERMDALKFSKARPVMSAIGELSERINTLKGVVATASGKAEKAKAAVNLNDDVAEYQSLVSGFTPMVARALGHTGVLTQPDVDSVKELFPKPEDSKSLRDRKIKRMQDIFSDLETAEKGPAAPGASAAPPAAGRVRVKGPNGETGTLPATSALLPGWTKVP